MNLEGYVDSMENAKIIILFVSLLGATGGVIFTWIANPPVDFDIWIVLFAMVGVIVANLILLILVELSKSFAQ